MLKLPFSIKNALINGETASIDSLFVKVCAAYYDENDIITGVQKLHLAIKRKGIKMKRYCENYLELEGKREV